MADKISVSKGFDDDTFDTYVPELEEAADIRNALELFYYGNSEDGNATGDVSLHATIVDFDARITANDSAVDGHTGAISDVHGVGAGNLVVGTGTTQTLTNKTLTSPTLTTPKVNENVNLTATSSELNILDGATLSTTELNYVDGVTSSIQSQINSLNSSVNQNTPSGTISIYSGASAPAGWLLCDGTSYASATYSTLFNVIGYTFGGSGSAFAVPNLKGRVVVGIDGAQSEFDTRGETGGSNIHQHASSTSQTVSVAHNHSIDPPSTGSNESGADHYHGTPDHAHNMSSNGGHDHPFEGSVSTSTTGVSQSRTTGSTISTNISNHSHGDNFNPTTTGDHAHNTGGGAANSGNASANHSHSVDIAAFNTTDGAGGSHAHTVPASDTLANHQPYMALNYIIKF